MGYIICLIVGALTGVGTMCLMVSAKGRDEE